MGCISNIKIVHIVIMRMCMANQEQQGAQYGAGQ